MQNFNFFFQFLISSVCSFNDQVDVLHSMKLRFLGIRNDPLKCSGAQGRGAIFCLCHGLQYFVGLQKTVLNWKKLQFSSPVTKLQFFCSVAVIPQNNLILIMIISFTVHEKYIIIDINHNNFVLQQFSLNECFSRCKQTRRNGLI